MLTREENELLCRVGPETPMGQSDFRNRVKATAYATREQGGLIWIWADSTANGRNKYTTEGDVIVHAPTLDRRPRFEVEDTPYGYWYSATRRPVVDSDKNKYVC